MYPNYKADYKQNRKKSLNVVNQRKRASSAARVYPVFSLAKTEEMPEGDAVIKIPVWKFLRPHLSVNFGFMNAWNPMTPPQLTPCPFKPDTPSALHRRND
jgi:hypothetical protein